MAFSDDVHKTRAGIEEAHLRKMSAGNLGGAIGSGGADVFSARRTPFDQMAETLDQANRLAECVESLANKLAGSTPTAGVNGLKGPPNDGLLYEYETRASYTASRLIDAFEAIGRIQAVLP